MSVKWKNFTINNTSHPLPPTYSPPGLAVNNGSYWIPGNVRVQDGNLQLSIERNSGYDWQGQEIWACAQAIFEEELNYGTYCIGVKVVNANGENDWARFGTVDPNPDLDMTTTLGIYLYDDTGSGGLDNPHCELDIVEIGYQNQGQTGGWISNQPGGPEITNGQFVVQPWSANGRDPDWNNLRRIAIDTDNAELMASGEMTFLMEWTDANTPVNFYAAYGAFNSANFPKSDPTTINWETPAITNDYIPAINPNIKLNINAWIYGGPSNNQPCFMQITNVEIP